MNKILGFTCAGIAACAAFFLIGWAVISQFHPARLDYFTGGVTVLSSAGLNRPAETALRLYAGDTIVTGGKSMAFIHICTDTPRRRGADHLVQVLEHSAVRLPASAFVLKERPFELLQGAVLVHADGCSPGEGFGFKAGRLYIHALGTKYYLSAGDGGVTVMVNSGAVLVKGGFSDYDGLTVRAGEEAVFCGGAATLLAMNDADRGRFALLHRLSGVSAVAYGTAECVEAFYRPRVEDGHGAEIAEK